MRRGGQTGNAAAGKKGKGRDREPERFEKSFFRKGGGQERKRRKHGDDDRHYFVYGRAICGDDRGTDTRSGKRTAEKKSAHEKTGGGKENGKIPTAESGDIPFPALEESYEQEVENLRDGLLFYLRFASKPDAGAEAPYTVDYSFTYEQRMNVVRTYYDGAYTDAKLKFEAFQADKVAVNYLGERYAPLYELYAQQAEGA